MLGRIASPDNTSCDNGQFSDASAGPLRLLAERTGPEMGTISQETREKKKGYRKSRKKTIY
jgi:hypothetical protein